MLASEEQPVCLGFSCAGLQEAMKVLYARSALGSEMLEMKVGFCLSFLIHAPDSFLQRKVLE